jgi:hypothetical protein
VRAVAPCCSRHAPLRRPDLKPTPIIPRSLRQARTLIAAVLGRNGVLPPSKEIAVSTDFVSPDFHVVFTIPDKLSSLALGNREEIYNLLFSAALKMLRDVIADEQLFEAAAVMVLHTWNQMLEAHAHLLAMVPGGGPSLNGDRRWIRSRRPNVKHRDGNYLWNSEELKSKFRENFLAGLRRLHASGKLNLNGD